MRSVSLPRNARDPLLHIEADGVLVNIEVGLTDADGHHVTRVDISPDDESRGGDGTGHVWYQDGARMVRLEEGEARPRPTQEELLAKLRELKAQGLTFGQIVPVYAEDNTPRQRRLITKAREQCEHEGEIEFDDDPIASGSTDRGDYVMAWVWVYEDEPEGGLPT